MKNIALYPGTFDPMTYGHIDIITRASKLFERVIVAVADNPEKQTWLTLEQRVALAQQALGEHKNIEVLSFTQLMTDFAKEQKANVIIRGLRSVSDFDYEFQLAWMNHHLYPELETLFMTPSEPYAHISSSLVREIAKRGGELSEFVPPIIADAIKK